MDHAGDSVALHLAQIRPTQPPSQQETWENNMPVVVLSKYSDVTLTKVVQQGKNVTNVLRSSIMKRACIIQTADHIPQQWLMG